VRCPRCRHENPPQSRYCSECGARLALACAGCGAEISPGAKFCSQCGLAAAAQARFEAPQAYTPKYLAEKILTSRASLEGERKQVTVLFADLKGSMELLAERDPEEARKILDPVLERMMEAVHRYEGTVNQVMGDGIMAIFGAPLAHEDHAVRACCAALRMQEAVSHYAEELRQSQAVDVQIRVGLNSGEVVVRAIRSDLRMDYTAVGQTTHLAARMEQLARPGTTLITADTLNLAEGYVQVQSLGAIPIKGLTDPVTVFELVGGGAAHRRFEAVVTRGLTRFVGRQAELAVLGQALSRARTGHGQLVAPVGEPGVGKSRLFWEFIHSHRIEGCLVLESGSVSYGKSTLYLPVIDLLKAYFNIGDRDDGRKTREKVTGKVLTLDRALEPMLSALLALLDVPVEDPQWEALDPSQRRQRTLEAVKRLLLRESQVQPLVLVMEDLHWIDSESQAVLDSVVESLPGARILLLVNYRPEYQHPWGGKTYYTQLRLDPLPPENAEELLEGLVGGDSALQPLKQLLVERTEGNPFFLEESVRTLVEAHALMGQRGAYRLARPLKSIEVPATVQAVLAARIDRLPPEEKRLLQTAAVIGKDVPFALLQAIADLPEEALRLCLAHLQAAEFLYETSLFPELEHTFKHALTHDVAYGSLLQERRCTLHARIVKAIEQLYAERLAEQVERLAHHAFRGEVWEQALSYLCQAGAKAFRRSASREAATYYEQAIAALGHLPESHATLQQAIDLRFVLQSALLLLGEVGRMLDSLRQAETLAEALGDQRRLGEVWAHMTHCFWWMGDPDRAVECGQRASAIAAALGDSTLGVSVNIRLGQAFFTSGEFRRALEVLNRDAEALEGEVRAGLLAIVIYRCFQSWCLAALGDFAAASTTAQEGVRAAEAADRPYDLAIAYNGVGGSELVQGNLREAIAPLERGLELCDTKMFAFLWPWIAGALGKAYALAGRIAEGVAILERAVEREASMKLMMIYPRDLTSLGEAYLLANRQSEAIQSVLQALHLTRVHKQRAAEAQALLCLAEIHSSQTPCDVRTAEESYREALTLAGELGMRPLVARCQLGLGKLYRRTRERPKAQEHLTTAATMLREMDMRFWLEQADAEMKTLA
jgi:class 3 adenylate cyclase/tetratricopeptide (TPR) repeat protein